MTDPKTPEKIAWGVMRQGDMTIQTIVDRGAFLLVPLQNEADQKARELFD